MILNQRKLNFKSHLKLYVNHEIKNFESLRVILNDSPETQIL